MYYTAEKTGCQEGDFHSFDFFRKFSCHLHLSIPRLHSPRHEVAENLIRLRLTGLRQGKPDLTANPPSPKGKAKLWEGRIAFPSGEGVAELAR